MSFEIWLKKHKKQNTPLGDLARDFINTECTSIERSFQKFSPCAAALDIYRKARKAYIQELSNDLHDELVKIADDAESESSIWHNSVEIIYDLKAKLENIDYYLDSEEQNLHKSSSYIIKT